MYATLCLQAVNGRVLTNMSHDAAMEWVIRQKGVLEITVASNQ